MPTIHKSQKTEPILTRWTKEQARVIRRTAKNHGISINELFERKIFDLPLDHPTEIQDATRNGIG